MVCVLGVHLPAQSQWMPPRVEQGIVEQLAGRLATLEPDAQADAGVTARAREVVKGIGTRLESWTDAVVISQAPSFPQLVLPTAEDPALAAMAAYYTCSMTQFIRFESGKEDPDRRGTILGLTATTMVVLRLRQPFVTRGGSMESIEAFLTSSGMEAILASVQKSPALMAHVDQQCGPVIRALVGPAAVFP